MSVLEVEAEGLRFGAGIRVDAMNVGSGGGEKVGRFGCVAEEGNEAGFRKTRNFLEGNGRGGGVGFEKSGWRTNKNGVLGRLGHRTDSLV